MGPAREKPGARNPDANPPLDPIPGRPRAVPRMDGREQSETRKGDCTSVAASAAAAATSAAASAAVDGASRAPR
eukprot:8109280-Alexandrium_andersonii.AAC.1